MKSSNKKKKNLNSIILKHKIKNGIYDFLAYLIIFTLALLFDKCLEMLVFVLSYTIIRNDFTKAVHGKDFTNSYAKGIVYCRIITVVVQAISLFFIVKFDFSKYLNIIFAFILGIINFLAKDYLEYKVRKVVFFKGMSKEDLPTDLQGIEYEIMYLYYVKRCKIEYIAQKVHYCTSNVKQLKANIIKRYSK